MAARTAVSIDGSHPSGDPSADPGDCPFCEDIAHRIIFENGLAVAIRDAMPASPLHTLVIPKRHVVTALGMTTAEAAACHELIQRVCEDIRGRDATVSAFNIGANAGGDAGQSVFHCHYHVIPRRPGDSGSDPGGIRHAMPGRRLYPEFGE